jgi:hypothetical protein
MREPADLEAQAAARLPGQLNSLQGASPTATARSERLWSR